MGYIFLCLFGVAMVKRISMLLCWPHPSALVAYNCGTMDVGHGPIRALFLGLILCRVRMTPCDTILLYFIWYIMFICYFGQVATNWWPHIVLGTPWTGHP